MNEKTPQIRQNLFTQAQAYKKLAQGADLRLSLPLFWTENLLLQLVRKVATMRLRQLTNHLHPDDLETILTDH
jgi:hypothetical protein